MVAIFSLSWKRPTIWTNRRDKQKGNSIPLWGLGCFADPDRALILGWVRSGQWVAGMHPPFGSGSACNPGWPAAPPAFMTESLLREVRWDAAAQAVVTPPMRELEQLRTKQPLATLGRTQLLAGERRVIPLASGGSSNRPTSSESRGSNSAASALGRQVEVLAYFERPTGQQAGHTFGISVLESTQLKQRTDVFFTAPPSTSTSTTGATTDLLLTIDAEHSGFLPDSCQKLLPPSHVDGGVAISVRIVYSIELENIRAKPCVLGNFKYRPVDRLR
jgi:hypothetical protein